MYIDYTESQKALRRELRAYFSALMTPELREGTRGNEGGDAYKQVIRQLGKDGWLALGWPKEYGGKGLKSSEQLVFFEEAQLAEVPLPFVTINTVAPALIALGSEEHKRFFLPKIAAGELHFAIGYTEPGAGTDLAALKTSAVRDGDDYVINGSKIWTSSAEAADYIWLAARTDPEAKPQHKGITIFMVNAKQPGFSFTPLHTVGGVRSNASYYDNVRVPASMIFGELNGGWKAITSQLNHERVGLAAIGIQGWGLLQRVLAWAQTTDGADGKRIADLPWVQSTLAEVYARMEAMRLMNWRMAWQLDTGEPDPAFASAIKAYSTECLIAVDKLMLNVTGMAGGLRRGSPGAALNGDLEEHYRKCQINTFGGGIAEVMRDLIAQFGLGMSAYSRR
ncbi:MAG: acyl-CoA dehydrogenase family protein [Pseudomonadales bacterium]|nr:acyl-CoA dehydrogenase family protein [Pseudomonadales bacterium]MBP7909725.1 acyl-CoA dehydrogenase family protein [Pseudomonadales bacterium]